MMNMIYEHFYCYLDSFYLFSYWLSSPHLIRHKNWLNTLLSVTALCFHECEHVCYDLHFVLIGGIDESQTYIFFFFRVTYVILQGLLCAHDAIAQKDYYPHLPEIPVEAVDEDEETVKIVQLVKSNEPLVSQI